MRQWNVWKDGAGKFFSTCNTVRIWHLRSFISSQTWKTSSCQAIQITWWYQTWRVNMAAWSRSHLLSTWCREMDLSPRQVYQQIRWLRGKIVKWIKRYLTMWGYLVAIKYGNLLTSPSKNHLTVKELQVDHHMQTYCTAVCIMISYSAVGWY
jgi:hypothetical protein